MLAYDLTPSVAVKLVSERRLVSQVTRSNFLLLKPLYKYLQAEAKRTTALPATLTAPAASFVAAGGLFLGGHPGRSSGVCGL